MNDIFVSYRRADAPTATYRIVELLKKTFGADRVFVDIEAIDAGGDFRAEILKALSACKVLVAVIGKEWLDARDELGNRKLDDPEDFVRIEIRDALDRRTPIIPVLVNEATMPKKEQLPEPVRRLLNHQSRIVHDEPGYHEVDAARLCKAVRTHVNRRFRIGLWAAGILVVLGLVLSCYFVRWQGDENQLIGTWRQYGASKDFPNSTVPVRVIRIETEAEKKIKLTSDQQFEKGPNGVKAFTHLSLMDALCETTWKFECEFMDGDTGTFELVRMTADTFTGTLQCKNDPNTYVQTFSRVSDNSTSSDPAKPKLNFSHRPPEPTVKAPLESELATRPTDGDRYRTLHYINKTNQEIVVWRLPKRYEAFDDQRQIDWSGSDPILPNGGEITDQSFAGGCFYMVIQERTQPSNRRIVEKVRIGDRTTATRGGWFDFAWEDVQAITIPAGFFSSDELDESATIELQKFGSR
jgi:hypothetical protein